MDAFILLGSFLLLIAVRMPVAYALGLSALAGAWWIDIPFHAVMIQVAGGVNKFSLLAIPFFVLAGAIMAEGGMSRRLVAFAGVLVGFIRGGLSLVNIMSSAFFGAISGSSVADTASVGSVLILGLASNWLAAGLLAFTIVFYAVIYSMWLKRATAQNIVIGGAAGALPPVIGQAVVTGSIGIESLILFAIIFIWTPPHFWALAIFRRADYAKADIPMLPVTHGVPHTRRQILFYSIALAVVSLMPTVVGMSGWFYLGSAAVLNAIFLWYAWRMLDPPDELFNMKMFNYSVVYLMALFAFLLLDHWLLPWLQPASTMVFSPAS